MILQDDSSGDTHEERELYLQFNVALTDVSAFLVDGDYNWSDHIPKVRAKAKSLGGSNINLLPVIDNCGIVLKLQQVSTSFVSNFLFFPLPLNLCH